MHCSQYQISAPSQNMCVFYVRIAFGSVKWSLSKVVRNVSQMCQDFLIEWMGYFIVIRHIFPQEVIGGMMDLEPRRWRKLIRENFDDQRKKVLQFAQWWKPFDCTKAGTSSTPDNWTKGIRWLTAASNDSKFDVHLLWTFFLVIMIVVFW